MHPDLEKACSALDDLATSVTNIFPDDRILTEVYGWLAPSITRTDAAKIAAKLATDIRAANAEACPDELTPFITNVPHRISLLKTHVLPQFPNGNIGQAFPVYVTSLELIRSTILPNIGWIEVQDANALPAKLTKRTTYAGRQLDGIEKRLPGLGAKISEIESAHAVAENLTVDLQALAEAREKIERASTDVTLQKEKILEDRANSKRNLELMEEQAATASKLIEQCEQAYHITTTKGLAGAFDQRANSLAWSMRGWVAGLAVALIAGSVLGSTRLASLSIELSSDTPKWGLIATHIFLSLLSVGAPLWFSWLATKQIGQRFRLSEDYAFKASVAKAYEGYRKEAAKLDPEFSAKLFGSALQRLEEAPLRLVESEQYGSPWHEFANSDGVRNAINAAPELQAKLMGLVRDTLQSTTKAASEAVQVVRDASKPTAAVSPEPKAAE